MDDADRALAWVAAEDAVVADELGGDHLSLGHVGKRFDFAVERDVGYVAMDCVNLREANVRAILEHRHAERAELQPAVGFDERLIGSEKNFLPLNAQLDRIPQFLTALAERMFQKTLHFWFVDQNVGPDISDGGRQVFFR